MQYNTNPRDELKLLLNESEPMVHLIRIYTLWKYLFKTDSTWKHMAEYTEWPNTDYTRLAESDENTRKEFIELCRYCLNVIPSWDAAQQGNPSSKIIVYDVPSATVPLLKQQEVEPRYITAHIPFVPANDVKPCVVHGKELSMWTHPTEGGIFFMHKKMIVGRLYKSDEDMINELSINGRIVKKSIVWMTPQTTLQMQIEMKPSMYGITVAEKEALCSLSQRSGESVVKLMEYCAQ